MRYLSIALIVSCIPALAAANAYTYGAGLLPCHQYVSEFNNSNQNDSLFIQMRQWALGYLSAAGVYGIEIKPVTQVVVSVYMFNYCKANPNNHLWKAVRAFVEEYRE